MRYPFSFPAPRPGTRTGTSSATDDLVCVIDVTLYDDDTGEVICRSEAIYGNGTEAGNENGYLIGMTPCSFLTPPVFPNNKKVRTVARYNNTEPHTGVMGLMLSTMYEVPA